MRSFVRRLHLLAAAVAGVVLVVAGITGSALVFRDELDRALYPELLRVEPPAPDAERVSLEHTLRLSSAAFPDLEPARIELARSEHEPHLVVMRGEDPLQVYVDPWRGRVLGARRESASLPQQLFEIHTTLLAGHSGEVVMGVTGLLLVFACASGLWLWWPGVRRGLVGFLDGVRVRRTGNWKRTNFDVHRVVGFWSAGLLALSGFTGAALVFHEPFAGALDRLTGSAARVQAPSLAAPASALAPADSLVTAGLAAIDELEPFYLMLPAQPNAPVVVRGRVPGELHPNGRNFAYLHPATGQLLAAERAREAPLGTSLYDTFYPLHIGRWGGPWSRLLYVGLGLTPLVLGVSGVLLWRNRTRRGRRPEARSSDRARASRRAA